MRLFEPGERKVRLIARLQSFDSQVCILAPDKTPKERRADRASGDGHVYCAGRLRSMLMCRS